MGDMNVYIGMCPCFIVDVCKYVVVGRYLDVCKYVVVGRYLDVGRYSDEGIQM